MGGWIIEAKVKVYVAADPFIRDAEDAVDRAQSAVDGCPDLHWLDGDVVETPEGEDRER